MEPQHLGIERVRRDVAKLKVERRSAYLNFASTKPAAGHFFWFP
jgi:hypothetical protein